MDPEDFLRAACLSYDGRTFDPPTLPGMPTTDLTVAAACGDVGVVRDLLPDNVNDPAGPFGWSPLMYVAYSRVPGNGVETARLLLDAGADPNDRRLFDGLEPPFTVLTGVFGGGEHGEPPHHQSVALARLLLELGADPTIRDARFDGTARDWALHQKFEYLIPVIDRFAV